MRRGRVLRGDVPVASLPFLGGRSRNVARPRIVRPGGNAVLAESERVEEGPFISGTRRDGCVDGMVRVEPPLGGTTVEHKNQHWKPMGPVICRYDHWSKPERKLRWRKVAPYAQGSKGHESCEPMGFDVAGDYLFVPYTGASKELGFSTGHIEVFKAGDGRSAGHFEFQCAVSSTERSNFRRKCGLSLEQRGNGHQRAGRCGKSGVHSRCSTGHLQCERAVGSRERSNVGCQCSFSPE